MSNLKFLGAAAAVMLLAAPAVAGAPALGKAAPLKGAEASWKAPAKGAWMRSELKGGRHAKPMAVAATGVATDTATVVSDGERKVIRHVVTNGPVPDTPETRAMYGGPMSRGGAMTAPVGN